MADISQTERINMICNSIKSTLLEKNKRYGNSALEPAKIFSKLDGNEGIKIRLDDKIKRIQNGPENPRKNDVFDLIGYLTLYCINQNWTFEDLID